MNDPVIVWDALLALAWLAAGIAFLLLGPWRRLARFGAVLGAAAWAAGAFAALLALDAGTCDAINGALGHHPSGGGFIRLPCLDTAALVGPTLAFGPWVLAVGITLAVRVTRKRAAPPETE